MPKNLNAATRTYELEFKYLSRRSFTALTSVENSISITVFFLRSSQIITNTNTGKMQTYVLTDLLAYYNYAKFYHKHQFMLFINYPLKSEFSRTRTKRVTLFTNLANDAIKPSTNIHLKEKYTFIGRVLWFFPASHERKIIASKKHLHMTNSSLQKL